MQAWALPTPPSASRQPAALDARLEVPTKRLFTLNGLEQSLEVPVAEAARAVA